MLMPGLGGGIAFNPMLLSAMSEVAPDQSGLASGVINTSFMMGGALGLAVLASLAGLRTQQLLSGGAQALEATNRGYHLALFAAALFAATAALISAVHRGPDIQQSQS